MSEAQEKVGKLVTDPNEQRDAIHVAIVPVVASCDMHAGQAVRWCKGSKTHVRPADAVDGYEHADVGPAIGVVDPFLRLQEGEHSYYHVKEGQRFWLFLYPRTVTGMRHHWEHPEFPTPPPPTLTELEQQRVKKVKAALLGDSEKWLRDYAAMLDCTYEQLLDAAKARCNGEDEYITTYGFDTPDRASKEIELFWQHFEIVTEIKVPREVRGTTFFSCSC